MILSFIKTKKRFLAAQTNKEIYKSLRGSFTGQNVHITRPNSTNITNEGLSHLANAKNIHLSYCNVVTDAGLVHLANVKIIDLMGCRFVTDVGLTHLKKVDGILLTGTSITTTGKQKLRARGVKNF